MTIIIYKIYSPIMGKFYEIEEKHKFKFWAVFCVWAHNVGVGLRQLPLSTAEIKKENKND